MAGEEKTAVDEISLFMTYDRGELISDVEFRNAGGDISARVDVSHDVWSFRVTNNFVVTNEDILMVECINQSLCKIKTMSHTYRIQPTPGIFNFDIIMEQIQAVASDQQIAAANPQQLTLNYINEALRVGRPLPASLRGLGAKLGQPKVW